MRPTFELFGTVAALTALVVTVQAVRTRPSKDRPVLVEDGLEIGLQAVLRKS